MSSDQESIPDDDDHLDNIYRLLNEHTALISQNQQTLLNISTEIVAALKNINERLISIEEKIKEE